MTFLNGILAAGAAAFLVPLAIHLLFRSRFRVVNWGAMYLLDDVIEINRRRIVWTNWLLLLLRCLIPILLALCLARPVLTGFRALPGDAPQSWVFVVDDSRSMGARGGDGMPRIERLKQGLTEKFSAMSRHDEVTLIRTGRLGGPHSRMGPERATEIVRQLTATAGPADLGRAIGEALEAAEEASFLQRRVVVASDFQSGDLGDDLLGSLDQFRSRLDAASPRPLVSFWSLGGDSESLTNLSVEAIEIESPAVVADRAARIVARVRNAGERPASNVRVSWTLDGVPLGSDRVSIAPRGTAVVRRSHTFPRTGTQAIGVEIDVADAIPDDNRRRLAVDVIDEIDVIIVDLRRGGGPLGGESDFLAIALSPFAFAGQDGGGAIRTRVVRPSDLAAQIAETRPDVVVLAGIPALDESTEAAVASAVLRGTALVVFDGDRVEPSRYNRTWGREDATVRLPAILGQRVGGENQRVGGENQRVGGEYRDGKENRDPASGDRSGNGGGRVEGESGGPGRADRRRWRIDEPNPQFSPWDVLRRGDSRPLESVVVTAFRELQFGRGDPPPRVLLRLTSGEPIAVDHPQGAGRVVQFAIGCHPRWSSLPLRPVFVPMMQQLMLSLARSRHGLNVDVGEPIRVPLDEFAVTRSDETADETASRSELETASRTASRTAPEAGRGGSAAEAPAEDGEDHAADGEDHAAGGSVRYTVEPPGEAEIPVTPDRNPFPNVASPRGDRPGVYRFRQTVSAREGATREDVTLRVAEVPASESQLRDAPPDRIEAFAGALAAEVYADVETLRSDDSVRRFGREVWRWLLAGLLVVMIAELLLARQVGGRAMSAKVTRGRVAGEAS